MRVLLIFRGLPGSGKSTLANTVGFPVVAADDFFIGPDGIYHFDASQIADAHEQCQRRARRFLTNRGQVTVANTFSQRWEMEPYIRMAAEEEAELVVIDLFDAGLDDSALEARNQHGVPVDTIRAMRARWEHNWRSGDPLPPWER